MNPQILQAAKEIVTMSQGRFSLNDVVETVKSNWTSLTGRPIAHPNAPVAVRPTGKHIETFESLEDIYASL